MHSSGFCGLGLTLFRVYIDAVCSLCPFNYLVLCLQCILLKRWYPEEGTDSGSGSVCRYDSHIVYQP